MSATARASSCASTTVCRPRADRIDDVSYAAARRLGFVHAGLTEAKLEAAGTAPKQ